MLSRAPFSGRSPLVQFRAGKMTFADGMVTADPRDGIVTVVHGNAGPLELFWGSGSAHEKTVLAPGTTCTKVGKCTTGDVYFLSVDGSTEPARCRFIWMQDPDPERIEAVIGTLRRYLERQRPVRPVGAHAASAAGEGGRAVSVASLQRIMSNITGPVRALDLQKLLASDRVLQALREDPVYYSARLQPHLPPGASDDVVAEVRNPQASAAAGCLADAASSSAAVFREVCAVFGLPAVASYGPGALMESVIAEAKRRADEKESGDGAAE